MKFSKNILFNNGENNGFKLTFSKGT